MPYVTIPSLVYSRHSLSDMSGGRLLPGVDGIFLQTLQHG